jgi:uncharacterized protein (TIGR03435 family)
MKRRLLLLPTICLLALATPATLAMQPSVAFDVASVKASPPPRPNPLGLPTAPSMEFVPGGFAASQATLRDLIRRAYDLPDVRVSGGPDWIAVDRFEIAAKAELGGPDDVAAGRAMLRSLLADRFGLRAHTETRQLPVFYLVGARDDGRLGPRLRRSAAEGGPERPIFRMSGGAMTMAFARFTMEDLARLLVSSATRRHVIEKTGLTGKFDGEVTFAPEPLPGFPAPPVTTTAVSLFTALPEQLGLRLDAGRGLVEVLIIDSAQRPETN